MALDKAIEHGKEKRQPYRGSKSIDPTCRNHGSCRWCKDDRMHKYVISTAKTEQAIKEYFDTRKEPTHERA